MFVYFELQGKQYIAKQGDIIKNCPFVNGKIGDIIYSEKVLGMDNLSTFPDGVVVKGATVSLKIRKQIESKKQRVVRFRPQKRQERWKGYRVRLTDLEVVEINWSK